MAAATLYTTSVVVSASEALFKELDAANQAFAKAIMSGAIDHLVGDHTETACIIAPSTPRTCGKEAIRAFWIAVLLA